ncbi:protoheme IX farnesyltransferase [Rhodoblastus acidophilus]|uniref:heme o synthase n=1 Tax=Rhodoblastus acidophilus TaxID=1074 RepID=UPI002224167B|nr:heme o synthase [Rhodoblastus acidophilus]MCW2286620.1 protoheme IX farnesyltransferase [Rhodoblastus acidophilus]MCW2335468.1 protoheme IX farnesyltransferase [Rhodoblastus acidophilus]
MKEAIVKESVAPRRSALHARVLLLKPRVMSLVVLTGAVGYLLAPKPLDVLNFIAAISAMAAAAGACGALNMWWDADIDAKMARTAMRPIPRGSVAPREALLWGLALAVLSVAAMLFRVNFLAGGLLALTIVIYIPFYTMGLKRRTPQNIVWGGAAGALPPAIGWAAASHEIGFAAFSLFLLIFLWTPAHFWALALRRSGDYARVGVPMLPNVAGPRETCRQIALYSAALVAASFLPLVIPSLGALYAVAAALLGGAFLWRASKLYALRDAAREQREKAAMGLFGFSILYLFGLFAAMLGDALIP